LSNQSATTTITHAVTVAEGAFAPGHLGELTQYLPFELVDDVLAQTGTVQRRLRDLPSRAGVYFIVALGLFPRLGYARVWGKLTAGRRRPRPGTRRDRRRSRGHSTQSREGDNSVIKVLMQGMISLCQTCPRTADKYSNAADRHRLTMTDTNPATCSNDLRRSRRREFASKRPLDVRRTAALPVGRP